MLRIFGHFWARKSCRRRSVSAALLAAYIVTAAGVPLPFGAKPQAGGEAYPCAHCGCGCATADQCWRSCCCHSLAERFAWAREHHVRPPEFAIAAAQSAGLDLSWLGVKGIGSHPATSVASCCVHVATDSHPSCCQAHQHTQPQKSNAADHIVAWRALACHGHSMNWLAAVPTLIIARPELPYDLPLIAWLGPAVSETAERVAAPPDVPPPERA